MSQENNGKQHQHEQERKKTHIDRGSLVAFATDAKWGEKQKGGA